MLKNNYCDCFLTQNNYLWFTNYSIMKKVLSAIAFVLISSMTFTSCITEEKDNTGPQIEIVTPEEGEVFAPGDVMNLHLKFKDADGIAVYKYEIYNEIVSAPNSFEDEREVPIGGFVTEFPIIHKITIPEEVDNAPTTPGTYIIDVKARDFNDNLSILRQTIEIVSEEE